MKTFLYAKTTLVTMLSFVVFHTFAMEKSIQQLQHKERSLSDRLATYSTVSNKLVCLSDKQLEKLLQQAPTKPFCGWGDTMTLDVDGVQVFVKKIPLTDLEQKPENVRSTANIFNLPLFYQYGVGSAGFGAWRELAANSMSTNWVLTGECENFPIMYHWRVLPGFMKDKQWENSQELDENVRYWNNSPAVRARAQALQGASTFVVMFLENIPEMLEKWLDKKFEEGVEAVDAAVVMVERQLESTVSFMASHGMYHFDAHFENILTDGNRLYFADLGLTACSHFDLSPEERAFFDKHKRYDQFYTRYTFAEGIAERVTASHNDAMQLLQDYADGKQEMILSSAITSVIKRYAAYAIIGNAFYLQLREVSKTTPYPAEAIEALCAASQTEK